MRNVTEMAKLYPEPCLSTAATAFAAVAPAIDPETSLAADAWTPRWYVASTRSRHEHIVVEQLLARSIECYLPLYESVRQWHDRTKKVQLPAFPGYLFVRTPFAERLNVLSVRGVTRLVTFGCKPASLPDDEVDRLRAALAIRRAEPHPYLATGTRVRIMSGPLRGLSGVVQRGQGLRIVISVDCLCRSIAVELQESDLQPE